MSSFLTSSIGISLFTSAGGGLAQVLSASLSGIWSSLEKTSLAMPLILVDPYVL